jgi:hypothetical protein
MAGDVTVIGDAAAAGVNRSGQAAANADQEREHALVSALNADQTQDHALVSALIEALA